MTRPIAIFSSVLFFCFSCQMKKENEQLKMQNAALQITLNRAQEAAKTLEEVGVLMDSIDMARNALQIGLEEGATHEDYVSRMKSIRSYVDSSEAKITQLEKELARNGTKNQAYLRTIARLRKDLKAKTEDISNLQQEVDQYKSTNKGLTAKVDDQGGQITSLNTDIESKKQELEQLQSRLDKLKENALKTEADAYFDRAQAVEETANRTKWAPKKKKATYKEALGFYEKALSLGRDDAQQKIDGLKGKI